MKGSIKGSDINLNIFLPLYIITNEKNAYNGLLYRAHNVQLHQFYHCVVQVYLLPALLYCSPFKSIVSLSNRKCEEEGRGKYFE